MQRRTRFIAATIGFIITLAGCEQLGDDPFCAQIDCQPGSESLTCELTLCDALPISTATPTSVPSTTPTQASPTATLDPIFDPTQESCEGKTRDYIVTVDRLNVRAKPVPNSDWQGFLFATDEFAAELCPVQTDDTRYEWLKIADGEYAGYYIASGLVNGRSFVYVP